MKPTQRLDALYAELPTIDCQQKCAESCGPILMTRLEWRRVIRELGYEPKGDLEVSLDCPMLTDGLCSIYKVRPGICRLWGVVDSMPCEWGCKPAPGYLTHAEGHDWLRRVAELSR